MAVKGLRGVRVTDLLTPANAFQAGQSAPTIEAFRDTTFYAAFFRHDQDDTVSIAIQYPHGRLVGRTIRDIHMHYVPMVSPGTAALDAYFRVRYSWQGVGGTFPALVGWSEDNVTVTVEPGDEFDHLYVDLLTDIAAPTGDTYSSILLLEVTRLGNSSTLDTYNVSKTENVPPNTAAANFCILAIDSHYPVEQDGSYAETGD